MNAYTKRGVVEPQTVKEHGNLGSVGLHSGCSPVRCSVFPEPALPSAGPHQPAGTELPLQLMDRRCKDYAMRQQLALPLGTCPTSTFHSHARTGLCGQPRVGTCGPDLCHSVDLVPLASRPRSLIRRPKCPQLMSNRGECQGFGGPQGQEHVHPFATGWECERYGFELHCLWVPLNHHQVRSFL